MSTKVVELTQVFSQDGEAAWVSSMWDTYNMQRSKKMDEWLEVRNYVFATDTSTTSNAVLPWKNSTTTPKLCQIRDNLHSNYFSALFPNDNWLSWEGYSLKDATKKKAKYIEEYMGNKCRESHFRTTVSKLLYDYIDYGNSFSTVEFVSEYKTGPTGEQVPTYIGPRLIRISPMDIVFNPMAEDFQRTPKIVRSVKTLGEIKKMAQTNPDEYDWQKFLDKRDVIRTNMVGLGIDDFRKSCGYQADGFGDMFSYFTGDLVEILEFYGDFHDPLTGELSTNKIVTIADRNTTVRNKDIPNWFNTAPIFHAGWRYRQDNLWAMGPLDNLVGMQYRIDHLENLKADAMDLIVHPPLAVVGEVEEFVWGPGVEIAVDEGGSITPLSNNMSGVTTANSEISLLESKMELYAGAPRDAMGIRTPGEKTMFEVQQLATAAGRIFQEKTTNFEVEQLEPSLNAMLEVSVRNMDTSDIIRVLDDDLGVKLFTTITKEDITASGVLRPIGARHFAQQSQDIQNFMGFINSPLAEIIKPHVDGKAVAKMVEDISNMAAYGIFKDFAQVDEQQQLAEKTNQAQEEFQVNASRSTLGSSNLSPQGAPQ